ncbi:MAG: DUF4870 domain-containing protein [Gammaproteobacteria bacterium]
METEENNSEVTTAEESSPSVDQKTSKEECNWTMGRHLASVHGFIIPLGNVPGPSVIWLIKKEEFPLVTDQKKEAVNFQITVKRSDIVGALLTRIFIGFLLFLALAIHRIVFTAIAAMRANEGEAYRYPYALRLTK